MPRTLLYQATDRSTSRTMKATWSIPAFLRRDEDTTDATYQALADRAQQMSVRAGAVSSFIRPELLALPDGTVERYMKEEPGLGLYAHVFEDMLREKPHVLSETEENLL